MDEETPKGDNKGTPNGDEEHSIVLYHGNPLAVISLETHLATIPPKARGVNLASDIFFSEYGVAGFVLVDHSPGEGRSRYRSGDYGRNWSEKEWEEYIRTYEKSDDLRVKCKKVAFPGTLKIVRYFVMPEEVGNFFRTDRFLGEPMIEKIVKDNLIPDVWWDPDNWEEHDVPYASFDEDTIAQYQEAIESAGEFAMWEHDIGSGNNHRGYQSFHLCQDFPVIRGIAQESIVAALTRFDGVLAGAKNKAIIGGSRRELGRDGTEYPTLYLPE